MPVFQPAPMRRWSPNVFKARPFSSPIIPESITQSTEYPVSRRYTTPFNTWYQNWKYLI